MYFPYDFILVDVCKPLNGGLAENVAEVWCSVQDHRLRGGMDDEVTGRSLTEIVLPILRLAQLGGQSLKTVLIGLEEADALHMGHSVALLIVDFIREVYLVRQEGGLGGRKGDYRCLYTSTAL